MKHSVVHRHSFHCHSLVQKRLPLTGATCCRLRPRWVARAEPEDKPDSDIESLFSKELHRRGLSSTDDPGPSDTKGPTTAGTNPFASGRSGSPGTSATGSSPSSPSSSSPSTSASTPTTTTRTRPRSAPPPMAPGVAAAGDDQRQRSMDLVNEGLAGFLPRAKVLLQLGGSLFLGFLPFMLVFSLLFTGVYFAFGDAFVHGGSRTAAPPPYVDPERLLSEPTVDPYVPYNANPYTAPDLR